MCLVNVKVLWLRDGCTLEAAERLIQQHDPDIVCGDGHYHHLCYSRVFITRYEELQKLVARLCKKGVQIETIRSSEDPQREPFSHC